MKNVLSKIVIISILFVGCGKSRDKAQVEAISVSQESLQDMDASVQYDLAAIYQDQNPDTQFILPMGERSKLLILTNPELSPGDQIFLLASSRGVKLSVEAGAYKLSFDPKGAFSGTADIIIRTAKNCGFKNEFCNEKNLNAMSEIQGDQRFRVTSTYDSIQTNKYFGSKQAIDEAKRAEAEQNPPQSPLEGIFGRLLGG